MNFSSPDQVNTNPLSAFAKPVTMPNPPIVPQAIETEHESEHETVQDAGFNPATDQLEAIKPETKKAARGQFLSRDQILNATEKVLDADGYDGTTIRRLARELDCAVGSIYRYFKDKRALLIAVTERRFEPVLHQLTQDPAHSLEASMIAYSTIARSAPQSYRLMFWLASFDAQAPSDTESQSDAIEQFPKVISEIIQHWAKDLGSPSQARDLWACLHGRIMLNDSELPAIPVSPYKPSQPVITMPEPPQGRQEDVTLL